MTMKKKPMTSLEYMTAYEKLHQQPSEDELKIIALYATNENSNIELASILELNLYPPIKWNIIRLAICGYNPYSNHSMKNKILTCDMTKSHTLHSIKGETIELSNLQQDILFSDFEYFMKIFFNRDSNIILKTRIDNPSNLVKELKRFKKNWEIWTDAFYIYFK
jgi:hypothetical protein